MNVYYDPESFGLSIIAVIDYSDGCYVFDTRIVWRHDTGFYTARDAGCSCPVPFEDFYFDNGKTNLEILNFDELRREVLSGGDYQSPNITPSAGQEFLEAVRKAIHSTKPAKYGVKLLDPATAKPNK